MTGRRLNIGLIGSGFMGQAHADAYRRAGALYRDLPATPRLFMLADANDALAQSAASRLGFEKSTGDWRKLVADPNVDVVDITSPNLMHADMALAAIAAGKHVYCEKPLAVTLKEAEAMAAAAKKAGVKTMVAFNNIKTPAAMLAKQLVERGDIGTPMRFRGWFDQGFYNDPDLPFFLAADAQGSGLRRARRSRLARNLGRPISSGRGGECRRRRANLLSDPPNAAGRIGLRRQSGLRAAPTSRTRTRFKP